MDTQLKTDCSADNEIIIDFKMEAKTTKVMKLAYRVLNPASDGCRGTPT